MNHSIVIAEVTRVEVAAALAARQRATNGITRNERDQLYKLLVQHCTREYTSAPITVAIADAAMHLTQQHRLRGYGAIQLAAALNTQVAFHASGLPAITFIAADDDLLAAAQAEGLTVDNPNQHP